MTADVLDPPHGTVTVLFQNPSVGIFLVDSPWNKNAAIRPSGRTVKNSFLSVRMKRKVGQPTVIGLRISDISQGLCKEAGHVHVEAARLGEDLTVVHPSETLVPLRTIGHDTHHIAPLRLENISHHPFN